MHENGRFALVAGKCKTVQRSQVALHPIGCPQVDNVGRVVFLRKVGYRLSYHLRGDHWSIINFQNGMKETLGPGSVGRLRSKI
jgi:hypothetical protein